MTRMFKFHSFLVVSLSILLAACSANSDRSDMARNDAVTDSAAPEMQWDPSAPPLKLAPDSARLNRIIVPSEVRSPNASYQRMGKKIKVSVPDFEVPVVGANKPGVDSKKMKAPYPMNRRVAEPQPQALDSADIRFDGLNFNDNAANTGFVFIPPDAHAAAGPNDLVAVTNTSLAFYTKSGTQEFQDSLADFFSPLSPLTFTFDPKVLYDQYEDRFVVITLERTLVVNGDAADTSRIFVAVSDDSDPDGTWYMMAFNSEIAGTSSDFWADYPGFAVDEEAVYITTNMFAYPPATGYDGVRLWVFDKGVGTGGLYDGSGATTTVNDFDPYAGAGISTTTQPTHMYGVAPASTGVFLVSYSGLTDGTNEYVQVVRIDNPLGSPVFTQTYISLSDIDTNSGGLPDTPQAGTASTIASNDRRALDAVWRDNAIWMTMTINPVSGDDSGQATAYWVKVDTTLLGALSIADRGAIGGEDIATGAFTTFPSIAVNDSEDVVVGFTASAPSIYPGAYFAGRSASDAAGTMGPSTVVRAGIDHYTRTFGGPRNRWGDYSATVVDPADGCFWVYNEWADTRDPNLAAEDGRWSTAFAKTCPGPSVASCSVTKSIQAGMGYMVTLPCDPSPANSLAEVFSAFPGEFRTDWVALEVDPVTQDLRMPAVSDPMAEGIPYILLSLDSIDLTVTGDDFARSDIDLNGVNVDGAFNLVGIPISSSVSWADVQVVDGADVLSISQYDRLRGQEHDCDRVPPHAECRMSRVMRRWNGTAEQVSDGLTEGMIGTIEPFDAVGVTAFKPGIKLRIPSSGYGPVQSGSEPVSRIDSDSAIEKTRNYAPWSVKLIAESGGRRDPGNAFGQLSSAEAGVDRHDLYESVPSSNSYFSILFVNEAFDSGDWGYTSDFRPVTKHPEGVWPFVVKASSDIDEITIRWEGESRVFRQAKLVDEQTGEVIKMSSVGSHTFSVDQSESRFVIKIGNGNQ